MAYNIAHNSQGVRMDIKQHIHGFDYAKFGTDPSMKLMLQAMVMRGRCKGGGELMLKEDLMVWAAIKASLMSEYKKLTLTTQSLRLGKLNQLELMFTSQ